MPTGRASTAAAPASDAHHQRPCQVSAKVASAQARNSDSA